ncbi:MAG: M3 family oligoendopeptidase [Cytophagales bacterium]
MTVSEIKTPRKRNFLNDDFNIDSWETLEKYYKTLISYEIYSLDDLTNWLKNKSELESAISEQVGKRYIKMTCFTENEEYRKAFNDYIENIDPNIAPYTNELNKKLASCTFKSQLTSEADRIMLAKIDSDIEIFREENIPLYTQLQSKQQEYGSICGAMTIKDGDKELTLQQANVKLQDTDRAVREKYYRLINERRLEEKDKLNQLYSELIALRHQIAQNAGFENFRDYMFKAMHRFDYTPQDCFDFHDSVKNTVVPLLNTFAEKRKTKLGVEKLRPWDLAVDPDNLPALKPFNGGEDLLQRTQNCFNQMNPFLGQCLQIMAEMEHLDLVSRKGKAPGGYNYPLDETGVPFIFMNAAGTMQDVITMLHEGGHAVHSIVTKPLALSDYRNLTSEIAELASMSMELISMDYWNNFDLNEAEEIRAKIHHLEHALETLPWVATIDKFQHWIYENPTHSIEERLQKWNEIHSEFALDVLDWSGLETYKQHVWQKQLHLFEVPFYYIEYGIAQLGAFGVWKNCKVDFQKGLSQYLDALKLGYSKSIKEVYATAGVEFNFSKNNITQIVEFVKTEIHKLEK